MLIIYVLKSPNNIRERNYKVANLFNNDILFIIIILYLEIFTVNTMLWRSDVNNYKNLGVASTLYFN